VTLVQPFVRRTDPETMDAVRFDASEPAQNLRDDMSMKMAAALERGMSRKVDERFSTARELREAFLDGPAAAPHEVGDWLRSLCGEELAVFEGNAAGGAGPGGEIVTKSKVTGAKGTRTGSKGTGSLSLPSAATPSRSRASSVPNTYSDLQAISAWPSKGMLAGALALGVAVAGAVFWLWPRPEPAPAEEEAPPLVMPVPPPGTDVPARAEEGEEPGNAGSATGDAERRQPVRGSIRHLPKDKPAKVAAPIATPEKEESTTALPTRPPPVAAVAVGYLTVDARPWAELYVDGQRVDRTPLSRYPLRLGEHQLLFTNPQLRREIRRVVTIREGKTETVRVDFAP
jgi:serine/threonine-protein kinase